MNNFKIRSDFILPLMLATFLIAAVFKQSIPFPYPLVQTIGVALLGSLLVAGHYCIGVNNRIQWYSIAFIIIVALNFIILNVAIIKAGEWEDIVKADYISAGLVIIFSLALGVVRDRLNVLVEYLFYGLNGLVGFVAVLGLYKIYLLTNGVQLDWVLNYAGGDYPWGTALTKDYNMFAVTLLIGLVVSSWMFHHSTNRVAKFIYIFNFVLCVIAGALAGSRRFWVLMLMIFMILPYISGRAKKSLTRSLIVAHIVLLALILLFLLISNFTYTDDLTENIGLDIFYRLNTLATDGDGFSEREIRWSFALDYFDTSMLLFGDGFKYLHVYSQKFTAGEVLDYPHNPIFSATFYGGILGFVASSLFYIYCFVVGVKLLRNHSSLIRSVGAIGLLYAPFVLVASNTLFSVSVHCFFVALSSVLADSQLRQKILI